MSEGEADESEPSGTLAPGPRLDTFRGASRVERALLPYLREQTLWPVFVVMLAHVVVLVAPLIVLMIRDGHGWSAFVIGVLGVGSGLATGVEVRDRGRPGLLTALLLATWVLCGVAAIAAVYYDLI